MFSNYPEGVSGGEYEVIGPDWEWEDIRECENVDDNCLFEGVVTIIEYRGEEWWDCPICGMRHSEEAF